MTSPKVLLIDIETAPIIMAAWTVWDANAVWVERDTYIMCFAAKWLGDKKTKTYAQPDYPLYKKDKHSDKALCQTLHDLLSEADIVVAHNGDAFDIKKINSRLIVNGYSPPSPFKTIDTLKVARRAFKFDSNKLDNIGRYLNEGRKIPNTGAALWRGCVNGDLKSWATMKRYNAQDVDLLEKVYERVKPWAVSHPNMNLYGALHASCPVCQSGNIQRRGTYVAKSARYQKLSCQSCGHWFKGDKL
jgi:DNA polymerase elongation subunit (family B)